MPGSPRERASHGGRKPSCQRLVTGQGGEAGALIARSQTMLLGTLWAVSRVGEARGGEGCRAGGQGG